MVYRFFYLPAGLLVGAGYTERFVDVTVMNCDIGQFLHPINQIMTATLVDLGPIGASPMILRSLLRDDMLGTEVQI